MAANLLRFRCYQCGKLLGIAPSKAGRTTSCPNCKAELIVPDPNERPEPEVEEALRAIAPIIDEPVRIRRSGTAPTHDPEFSWDAIDPDVRKAVAPEPPFPFAPEPTTQGEIDLKIETGVDPERITPTVAVEVPPVREPRPARRSATDLVLSQSVSVSLALFALSALAVAFVAGLLFGHFVWKPR